MFRLLVKINTCLVAWLPVWRAGLEGSCITADISSATLQFNKAAYFDFQKAKQKQIGFAPGAIQPALGSGRLCAEGRKWAVSPPSPWDRKS